MKLLHKKPTFIIQPNCDPILTSFVEQISGEGQIYKVIASEENLSRLKKENKFSIYTTGMVAFGDGKDFGDRVSDVTSLIFSSPDVILAREYLGVYTRDQAEELYRTIACTNKNLPQTYQLFKSNNTMRIIKGKIEKLGKIFPPFYNFLERVYETENKKSKTIYRCDWIQAR